MAEIIISTKGGDGGIFDSGLASTAQPGDIISIDASVIGTVSYFYGGAIQGTPEAPIKIRNKNGQLLMTAGFNLDGCQNIILAGDGDGAIDKGISINSGAPLGDFVNGAAVNITGLAKNIEVTRLDIDNVGVGLWCKNEPLCDEPVLNAWIIENINFHHNSVKNVRVEGCYIGSTNVVKNGANVRPITCGGVPTTIHPPQLGNIKINDNFFDGTGRSGIQMSQCSIGLSEILRNTVRHAGREYQDAQGNGIFLGSQTRARVANNDVADILTAGIASFGEYAEIISNAINNTGILDGHEIGFSWGIWLDTRQAEPFAQQKVFVIDNTIGFNTGPNKIGFYDTYPGAGAGWLTGNVIRNNQNLTGGGLAFMDVSPGIDWSDVGGLGGANLFGSVPACCVAKETVSFIEAGITAQNTTIIYEVGSPLKSYMPGRSINAISGFTQDKGYFIHPKSNLDLSAILAPPFDVIL